MIYAFKETSHLPAKMAQTAGETLARIRSRGDLTPSAVVDASRPARAPLHGMFEWDDKAAAEAYREAQAAHIIRCLVVQVDTGDVDGPVATRAFVSVSGEDGPVYESIQVALKDETMRRDVLIRALRDLTAWQRKYAEIEGLAHVFQAVRQAARELQEAV